ncbi:MAG: GDSL-type esterase/lipase family protein [Planctomycetota bacterium]|nr:GDSL-type esterase/lipase family protein [Planctomycetota bacterium]
MPTVPRRLLLKLGLAAATIVLAVLAVEGGLRLAGYEPIPLRQGGEGMELVLQAADHPILTYELRPNGRGWVWNTEVAINSHGFRDAEYALEKTAGVVRIVALGDSVTFGNEQPQEATWPEVLERLPADSQPSFEVLNLGVAGYNTLEEVIFLEQTGLAFDPDVVVLQVHVNDLAASSISADGIARIERYRSPLYRWRLVQLLRVKLDRRQLTRRQGRANDEAVFAERYGEYVDDLSSDRELRGLMDELRRRIEDRGRLPVKHRVLEWYTSEVRVGRLRHALRRLAELREAHGFEAAAFVLPCFQEAGLEREHELAYAITEHELVGAGLHVVPIREITRRVGHDDLRKDTWHPNERGQGVIARGVLRFLAEEGLLAPKGER